LKREREEERREGWRGSEKSMITDGVRTAKRRREERRMERKREVNDNRWRSYCKEKKSDKETIT
jgi:hypothetical protein